MLNLKKMLTKILASIADTNTFITDSRGRQFQDISDKITMGGAWTPVYKHAWLVDGIVYFNIEAQVSSYQANYQYTIATIAAGYRPRTTVAGQGHTTNGSYSPQSIVNVMAGHDGALKVSAQNTSGEYFFVSGWYRI